MRMPHHRLQLLLATLLTLGIMCIMAGTVSARPTLPAHASVQKAIPAIGSTIAQAPTTVTVFTVENMNPDPKKSNLRVYGPTGEATNALISQGDAKVSLSDPKQMAIPIKPDSKHSDGVYVVQWFTVSAVDGDPDSGAFTFTVNSGATAAPTAATTTGNSQNTTPSTPTTTPSFSGTPIWVPIIVGILALLVGLGGGLGLGQRSTVSSISAMRRAVAQQQADEESVKRP